MGAGAVEPDHTQLNFGYLLKIKAGRCCLSATARDYAKLGHLILHSGNWQGEQILPEDWVAQSTKVDTANGSVWNYQYQW